MTASPIGPKDTVCGMRRPPPPPEEGGVVGGGVDGGGVEGGGGDGGVVDEPTTNVSVAVPLPNPFVALTVTNEVPAVVGVPVIRPVVGDMLKPTGSVPVAIVNDVGSFVAETWKVSGEPIAALIEAPFTTGTDAVGPVTVNTSVLVVVPGVFEALMVML